MPLLRRRPPDPEILRAREAFRELAVHLDRAQRSLLAVIPTSRDTGVPLAQGIAEFERELRRVEELMPTWRIERTERDWADCAAALREALDEVERLRLEPRELGFEALNWRIGEVLDPLERFVDAERALLRR